jgi:hypothetical protein
MPVVISELEVDLTPPPATPPVTASAPAAQPPADPRREFAALAQQTQRLLARVSAD